jgi:hypothetical protein
LNTKTGILFKRLGHLYCAAKKNESIFVEVDLSGWNEVGERMKK